MTIKNKAARKILLFVMSLGVVLSLGLPSTYAGAMTQNSTTLSNPSSGSSAVTYTFTYYPGSTNTIKEVDIQLSATAPTSGSEGSITGTGVVSSASLASIKVNGTDVTTTGSWTGNAPGTQGLYKVSSATGASMTPSTPVVITLNGVVNPTIGNCTSTGGSSTDTCYANLIAQTSVGSGTVDTGSSTFTVTSDVSASATINPSLTFTVAGITNNVTSSSGVYTTTASTYNSLPFGNITPGATNIYTTAQTLNVTTNSSTGYEVQVQLVVPMTGRPGNTIGSFQNSSTWNAPTVWAVPTAVYTSGSYPNVGSSYLGLNTTDTRLSSDSRGSGYAGWSAPTLKFAPLSSATDGTYGTAHDVMYSSTADNGTPQTISYQLQTDVSQPADSYTGTLKYSVIANY